MRALVTGIGGFVGPYLTRHLISSGFDVVGIEKNPSPDSHVFSIDILDAERVFEVVSEVRPDFVFHLAGQSSVVLSWEKPKLTHDINVTGTKNLLDALVRAKLNPKVLVVSSVEVYGTPKSVPVKESAVLAPQSPYAESRVEQEKLAHSYSRKFPVVVSRSFHHIGPGQSPLFVCSDFARQIAEAEKGLRNAEVLVGNLKARRDFTDVRDMVRAYLLALQKCSPGVYNLCSGRAHAIKDILDIMLGFSGIRIKVRQDKSKLRKKDIAVLEGDNSKFVRASGWKPDFKIEQTLKDILDYWREQV